MKSTVGTESRGLMLGSQHGDLIDPMSNHMSRWDCEDGLPSREEAVLCVFLHRILQACHQFLHCKCPLLLELSGLGELNENKSEDR